MSVRRVLRAAAEVWRQPMLLVATFAAGLLLAASGAVAPVYVSNVRNGALADELGAYCPWDAGHRAVTAQLTGPITGTYAGRYITADPGNPGGGADHDFTLPAMEELQRRVSTLDSRLAGVPKLGARELSFLGPTIAVHAGSRSAIRGATLLLRQGEAAHVHVLSRAGGGIWLPDTLARALRVSAGDRVVLGRSATFRVGAVYRDLATTPRAPFWCSLADSIWAPSIFGTTPPPVVLLPDRATLLAVSRALGSPSFTTRYERPLVLPLTVSGAREVTATLASATDPFQQFLAPPSVRLLDTKRVQVVMPDLTGDADRADAVAAAVGPPVSAMAWGAAALALALAAATGTLWVERRRREVALLHAKGVSPGVIAGQALAECAAAFVAGSAVGWATAVLLVGRLGPGPLLDPGTGRAAAVRAVVAAVAGAAVLAATVGFVARAANGQVARGGVLRRVTWVPWELLLVGGAWLLFRATDRTGALTDRYGLAEFRGSDLGFVLLVLAAAAVAGGRLITASTGGLRRRAGRWPPAAFLAARRMAASLPAVALATVTLALPAGLFVAANVTTATLGYTTTAKAKLFVGSDSAYELTRPVAAAPAALRSRATVVTRIDDATLGGRTVQVLGVDPSTFAHGAFWDPRFAARPLSALMSGLGHGGSGPVPAIIVGVTASSTAAVHLPGTTTAGSTRGTDLALDVIATPQQFPGMKNVPVVVVPRSALAGIAVPSGDELWVAGDPGSAARAVAAASLPVRWSTTAASVSREPDLVAVTWTFGFLQGLAVLVGVIAVGGLLLYLNARERRATLAYVFARRMGLSRASHLRSVAGETGLVLGWAAVVGSAAATAAVSIVVGRLDPNPYVPPPPLFTAPARLYLASAAAAALLAALATGVVHRTAERARPAELLKAAE